MASAISQVDGHGKWIDTCFFLICARLPQMKLLSTLDFLIYSPKLHTFDHKICRCGVSIWAISKFILAKSFNVLQKSFIVNVIIIMLTKSTLKSGRGHIKSRAAFFWKQQVVNVLEIYGSYWNYLSSKHIFGAILKFFSFAVHSKLGIR